MIPRMDTDDLAGAITPTGLAEMRGELERLEGPERRRIADEIRTARGFGDLSENAEYHEAKRSQGYLEGRIAALKTRIDDAKVVEPAAGSATVRFGSTVEVEDAATGRRATYRLVGDGEADLAKGMLSLGTPVARALLGAASGSEVTVAAPRGARTLRVVHVG